MQQSTTVSETGARPENFTGSVVLWGNLETLSGSETLSASMRLAQSDAVITLAQWPAVSAKDELIHRRFGERYQITGIVRKSAPNETVCNVTKYDGTQMKDQ
jgi:head-tail adaptor